MSPSLVAAVELFFGDAGVKTPQPVVWWYNSPPAAVAALDIYLPSCNHHVTVMHTHTRLHTHAHTLTQHAHIQDHTHTKHAHTNTQHAHTLAQHTHPPTHAHAHVPMHTTHSRTLTTHTRARTHTAGCTHAHMFQYKRIECCHAAFTAVGSAVHVG